MYIHMYIYICTHQPREPRHGSTTGVPSLPDGWRYLEPIDLIAELLREVQTLQAVPFCIRESFSRIQTQALAHIKQTKATLSRTRGVPADDERRAIAHINAWKLFLLLPRLVLHKARRGGEAGERELRRRVTLFDAGEWGQLLDRAHATQQGMEVRSQGEEQREKQRLVKVMDLIQRGELSHAARTLKAAGFASATASTLEELRNPELRPREPSEAIPESALDAQPAVPISLSKDVFGIVLRQSRRGKSSGLSGCRNEYLRICLENDCSFDLLHAAAQDLARAEVPEEVVRALALSKLTALLKPNGRVRGIASGCL